MQTYRGAEYLSKVQSEWDYVQCFGLLEQLQILKKKNRQGEDITPSREKFLVAAFIAYFFHKERLSFYLKNVHFQFDGSSTAALDPVDETDSRTVLIGDCSVLVSAIPDPDGVSISLDVAYGDLDSAGLSGDTISVAQDETGTLAFTAPMTATSETTAVMLTLSDEGEQSDVLLSPKL